jgi:hypothetical protein
VGSRPIRAMTACNGHGHTQVLGALQHGARAVHTLGHMAQGLHRLGQGLPLCQRQAHFAVAGQIPGRGEYQIAQAAQTHKRLGFGTQGQAQTGDFGQAACDQGRTGVQAQLQAVTQAGGNGQHVFHGAAHFHPHHVVIRIDPQGTTVEGGYERVAHRRMRTGSHQRGGLPCRHLLRKTGAAEHPGQQLRCGLRLHLMAQQAVGALHRRLKPLAEPGHRRRHALQLGQQTTQCGHGRGHHHQIGRLHRRQ